MKKWVFLALLALALAAGYSSVVIVDETQMTVITRFGDPTRTLTDPGLYFKAPLPVDRALAVDKRLLVLDVPSREEAPREFLTLDKKNIEVSTYACWKVTDALQFMKTLTSRESAEAILRDAVLSACGKTLASHPLGEMFSITEGQMKLGDIQRTIHETCEAQLEKAYGIDIVDVRLKRINLPEANRSSVFERMRKERQRFASQYLNEGEEEAVRIRSQAKTKEQEILGQAYEEAKRIEAEAEAKAYAIYAEAYERDPEFYEFLRNMESLEKTLTQSTTLFLPADHPYLKGLTPWLALPKPIPTTDVTTPPPGTSGE
ncbi:MAG: protease modulator HflC [Phycisphaerales bacterium]|nr:protease modulator HflC [Phycisphaerales bacterium]